jgi:pyruvate dehydrogenase E2 component (dihydrolipoamide acetyltransferase)
VSEVRIVRQTGARKIIAERMLRSHLEYAELSISREVDVTALVAVREALQARLQQPGDLRISYTHLISYLTARVLRDHPYLNSTLVGQELQLLPAVHLGIAVETPDGGLVVPVVTHADQRPLLELASVIEALVTRAREKKLRLEDVSGGTFTLTNYGVFGADLGTPLINPPQSAILGLGRIVTKPVWLDGQVVPRSMMWLSLTYDHRVIYGGQAARFLAGLAEAFQHLTIEQLQLEGSSGATE